MNALFHLSYAFRSKQSTHSKKTGGKEVRYGLLICYYSSMIYKVYKYFAATIKSFLSVVFVYSTVHSSSSSFVNRPCRTVSEGNSCATS